MENVGIELVTTNEQHGNSSSIPLVSCREHQSCKVKKESKEVGERGEERHVNGGGNR